MASRSNIHHAQGSRGPSGHKSKLNDPRPGAFAALTLTPDCLRPGARNCPRCGIRLPLAYSKRRTHVQRCTGKFRVEYLAKRANLQRWAKKHAA